MFISLYNISLILRVKGSKSHMAAIHGGFSKNLLEEREIKFCYEKVMNSKTGNRGFQRQNWHYDSVQHIPWERVPLLRDMNSHQREIPHCVLSKVSTSPCLPPCFPCNLLFTIQLPWYLDARKRQRQIKAFQPPETVGLSAVLVETTSQPNFSLCPISSFTSLPQVLTQIYFLYANV